MANWQDAPIVGGAKKPSWQDAPIVGEAPAQAAPRVQKNPDGTYGTPPEGAYVNPETGQMIDPAQKAQFQERVIQAYPFAARAQEFVQGAPFIGEFFDEALGLFDEALGERSRMVSDAFEAQRPGQSLGLNVAGGVVGSLPAAALATTGKVADFVARGGNMLTRGLRAGAIAAPAGAVEGAASFAGRADTGQRGDAAITGALVGGGLGALLGPVATMTGESVTSLAKRVKSLDVATIAEELGVSPRAARVIRKGLLNDNLDEAQQRLAQLGDDAMLADAGQGTAALLDASANTGGAALKVAREAADGRANTVGKRLSSSLDRILGEPKGVKTAAREISQTTSRARQAAYDAAYSKPINYADATGRNIEGVLARIPPRTMKAAIDEANDAMRAAGVTNKQIMAEIGDDGSVVFREMPNVQQLDEIKKALDGIGRESVDQFGRPTSQGVRARKLATDLRDALKDAVPEYGVAVRKGGDKIQQDEGLALGKTLLFKNTTVEDVKAFLNQGVSNEARQAVRQGIRESIEQNLSNVRRTITDPNVDAREAMQLVKEMSSRANKEKLRLVLGEVRANRLLQEMDRTAAALELRAAISQNSKTAIRQSIQDQVADETAPNLAQRAVGNAGNPFDSAQEITKTIAGIDPRSMSAREKSIFDEIASVLVNTKGAEAQAALQAIRQAMSGQPLKDAQAALIGRVVAGAGGLTAYQSGKQSLAR